MKNHNHLAVWLVIILHQVLGYIWYAPFLFLNVWLAGQGRTMAQLNASGPAPIIWSIVANIIAAYTISWLIIKLDVKNFWSGAKLGVVLSAGFFILGLGAHYKFLGIADSVVFIDLGLLFVWTIIAASILAAWRKKM
ncbi:MAG TPA: DUF1761 domain-containing protein [Candidatus Udaeobacter sp.]|nr:DUF1761 domain-containing protein [Candidatus Udaeobacter sp.]